MLHLAVLGLSAQTIKTEEVKTEAHVRKFKV